VKGKHQRTQRRRRDQARAARLEQLRAELEAETQRANAAHHGADLTRTARARLAREQAHTQRRLHSSERVAGQLVVNTAHATDAIAAAGRELRAVQRELSLITTEASLQQLWQMGVKTRFQDLQPRPQPALVRTWYRHRTGRELNTTRSISLAGWVPDDVPNDRTAMVPYATSTVHDTTPEACWSWAIPPWLAVPEGTDDAAELRAQLGAVSSGQPILTTTPYPRRLRRDATITTPWRHPPAVGHVNDAIDLTYWYHRSAWTQRWHPDRQAVPFWLPAEHATAYPQAQPLPADTDLRLPHPLVFAAFAAPWRIQPRSNQAHASIQTLLMYARGNASHAGPETVDTVLGRLQSTGLTHRADLPTPLELLDHYGGTVEGLLLAANNDGTPADDFAWCLAIYQPCGFPLARIAVPASRAKTQWRQQVDNLIAGIALSSWHEHDHERAARGDAPTQDHPQQAHDDTAIRILDIDATSPHTTRPDDHQTSGRISRPHLRRGHWRRVPAGPQRRDRRWTWVRATTVNAGYVSSNQVYVLR
jgi:hypothetical protein